MLFICVVLLVILFVIKRKHISDHSLPLTLSSLFICLFCDWSYLELLKLV